MKTPTPKRVKTTQKRSRTAAEGEIRIADIRNTLVMAEKLGLLAGARTHVLRGRMPVELVAEAKRNSGITSDSKLLEAALANIALKDDYWEWMRKHQGTVSPDLDLEI